MRKIPIRDLRHVRPQHVWHAFTKFFTDGWYFKGDAMSQDRMRLVTCNYTSNIIANLIGGTFLTGLLLLMNADDAFMGTITMISTAANMLQMFAPLLLERFKQRKKILIAMRGLLYLLNIVLVGIAPLFPIAQQSKLMVVVISVLLVNLLSAFSAPGINIWHIQSIPNNVRQSYFSIVTMTVGAVVALCNLAASALVDHFRAIGLEYQGLLILRVIALVIACIELVLYAKIREYPYESSNEKVSVHDLLLAPLKNKLYLRTVLVACLWQFSASLPGSYHQIYMLKDVGVSYSYIMLISSLNVPAVLLLTPFWKRVLQKLDWFRTLQVGMLLYSFYFIGLSFASKGTLFFYPLSLIWAYVIGISINLSFTGIPYLNMPQKNQTAYIGFYSTMINLAAFLGVTLSKYFVLATEGLTLNLFGFEMVNKQYLVLLTGVMVFLSSFGVKYLERSIKKKAAAMASE